MGLQPDQNHFEDSENQEICRWGLKGKLDCVRGMMPRLGYWEGGIDMSGCWTQITTLIIHDDGRRHIQHLRVGPIRKIHT